MQNIKEIRTKTKSIQNTQKITKAMEMVAASKMRKAQQRMLKSRHYANKIKIIIDHMSKASLEYKHIYTTQRKIKSLGFIIISTDRGLCGGLNINLFKKFIEKTHKLNLKKIKIKIALVGKKSFGFFKRVGGDIIASINSIGDKPKIKNIKGIVNIMTKSYISKEIDGLYIIHNKFINTMIQKPLIESLLPISNNVSQKNIWDYIYEPSPKYLIDLLFDKYLNTMIYQGVVENMACEQAARMVAMKSASDNAGEIIDNLKLIYNKARQSAITQELSEIVGGADAV